MKYTIDRFEEGFALLEDEAGEMRQIPRTALPPEAREGDRLEGVGTGYVILAEETRAAQAEADSWLRRLLNRKRRR
ncbi:MAG: DUF3006 domain-containing protein [Oscillospiraceae bacterium]|nr:DUF3006 domain-containing protein [Oscillospiraceae bacterium]